MYCSCSNAQLSLRAKPSLCYSRRLALLDDGRCDEYPLGRLSVNPRFLLYGYYLRQSSLIYWSPLRTFLTGHGGHIYSRLSLRDEEPCSARLPPRRAECRVCCCCRNSERSSRMIRECCRENFGDSEDEIDCDEFDHSMWYAKRVFETRTNCGQKRQSLRAREDGSSPVCASCGHKSKENERREISRESSGSPAWKKRYDKKKINASRREVHDDCKYKNAVSLDSSEESDHREREYNGRVSNSKARSTDSKLIGLSHRERDRHSTEEDDGQIRVSRKRSGNHARVSILDEDLRKEAKDKHSVSSMKQHGELQQRLTEQDNLELDKRVRKSASWGVLASRRAADNRTKEKMTEEESKKGSRKLMTESNVHGDDTLVAFRSNKYVNEKNIDIAESSSSTLKQHHQIDKRVVDRADLSTDVSNEYIHNENQCARKNESLKGSQRFFRISEVDTDNAERISSLDSMLDRRKVRDEQSSLSNLRHSTAIEKTVGSCETQEQFENLRRIEEVRSSNIQRASHEERRYSEEVIKKRDDESISVHIARDKIGQVDQQIIDKKEFDERCENSVFGFHLRENRNASNTQILCQSRVNNQADYSTSTTNLIHLAGKNRNQSEYHYSQQSGSLRGSGRDSPPKLSREDSEKISKAQVVISLDIKNELSDHQYNSRRESIEDTKISEYSIIDVQRDSNSQEFSDMQMGKHKESSLLMVQEESKELGNLTGESSHSRSEAITSTGTLEGGSSFLYARMQQLDDQTNKDEAHLLKGDTLDSAARLESSSTLYVGEFVNKLRQETSSLDVSGTQTEETHTKFDQATTSMQQLCRLGTMAKNNEYKHIQEDSRRSSSRSEMKGPSDKIWDVTSPIHQEDSRNEEKGEDVLSAGVVDSTTDTPSTGNAIARRSSKSLWAHIADIIRMGWVHRAESHTSTRKSGKKSSSEGSEAWFSGQDASDNENDADGQSTNLKESVPVGGPIDQDHGTHSSITQGSLEAPGVVVMQLGSGASTSAGISVGDVSIGASSGSRLEEIELVVNKKGSKDIPSSMTLDQSPPLITDTPSVTIVDVPTYTDTVAVPTSGYMKLEEDLRGEELSEVRKTEGKDGELKRRKFQRKNQLSKETFEEWEEAFRLESEQRRIDEFFMREALVEAQKAADIWEVPVGAVLVHQGKIIARGFNLVEERRDSTAHAEMICIREASNLLRTWRLADTTLYVTLEPCPMCAGAILQARIDAVVWGAPNKLLGADGSWVRLFPGDGGSNSLDESSQIAGPVHPFHPNIKIRRGVLTTECSDALQQFFQLRRKKKKKQDSPPQSCLPVPNNPIKLFTKMHNMFSIIFCL